jgi:hypothetical protein
MLFLPAIPGNPYLRSAFLDAGGSKEKYGFSVQCATGSGGTGIGMSVVMFHPFGVLIQINTITNGLGTGFWLPYASVIRTGA